MTSKPMFVYRPRSRDRVFAENPNDDIVIVTWANGCRHIIGGVHFSFETAEQKKYWRSEARIAAKLLIETCGGIAWTSKEK